MQVIQCDKWATKDMPQKQFFDVYQGWNPDTPGENLKVKDFPPQGLFQRVMPRHNKVNVLILTPEGALYANLVDASASMFEKLAIESIAL